jgi:hypothetical protein
MAPLPEQVAGVVVAYHPDLPALQKLVTAARPQLSALVVIDNTPADAVVPIPAIEGVEHISRGFNAGVAEGLNQGFAWARAKGAKFVLMFDQDSVPAHDMLDQLIAAWNAAEAAGVRVAAAGPRFADDRGATVYPFLRVRILRNKALVPQADEKFIRTDTLITSGCLVSLAAIDDAGGMDESLFIDNVDHRQRRSRVGLSCQAQGLGAYRGSTRRIAAPHRRRACSSSLVGGAAGKKDRDPPRTRALVLHHAQPDPSLLDAARAPGLEASGSAAAAGKDRAKSVARARPARRGRGTRARRA